MKETTLNYWKTALIILGVVACGLLVINQTIKFMGYNRAINDPCGTCASIPENEHLVPCFEEHSNVVIDPVTGEVIENKNKYRIDLEGLD